MIKKLIQSPHFNTMLMLGVLSLITLHLLRNDKSFVKLKRALAQTGGQGVLLYQGLPGCTTGVNCCPPGFTELTAYDNRLIMVRTDPVGTPTVGGGDGSHAHGGGAHSHPFTLQHDPNPLGGAMNPNDGSHSHSGGSHDHQFIGFRLCQWDVD